MPQNIQSGSPEALPAQMKRVESRRGDRIFFEISRVAGVLILISLAAVALFLLYQSLPAFLGGGDAPIMTGKAGFWDYVLPFAFGTVWISALALIIATPIAIGVALFITQYASRGVGRICAYIVDLLAAIPSVVFGLWGIIFVAPTVQPIYTWFEKVLGWIPLFRGPVSGTGRTALTAALILALMILPIMSAMCREVFTLTPPLNKEAAFGLGATRWEMIRMVVLPYGRSGIVSALMLGLGRALGETMAVTMVMSPSSLISFSLLTPQNPNTIASNIALNFPEAFGKNINVLIATGLILFAITLVVNILARWIIAKKKVG